MIRCNKCGYIGSYYGPSCPSCKEIFSLTPEEIEDKIRETSENYGLQELMLHVEKQKLVILNSSMD